MISWRVAKRVVQAGIAGVEEGLEDSCHNLPQAFPPAPVWLPTLPGVRLLCAGPGV
jgi:hypothetical protein